MILKASTGGQRVGPDGTGPRRKNGGFLRVQCRHNFFIIRRHFHRRMDVLQADENDVRAQLMAVRLGLDAVAQDLRVASARPPDMISCKSALTR